MKKKKKLKQLQALVNAASRRKLRRNFFGLTERLTLTCLNWFVFVE